MKINTFLSVALHAVVSAMPRANSFQLTDKVARAGLLLLRKKTLAVQFFDKEYEAEFNGEERLGDTIRVRRRKIITPTDFTTSISVQNLTETNIPLVLDFHKDTSFELTQKDMTLNINQFASQVLEPAMVGMSQAVDAACTIKYKNIPTVAGASAAAPAALPTTIAGVAQIKQTAEEQFIPNEGRVQFITPTLETAYLSIENLVRADARGDAGTAINQGFVGRVMGMDTFMTQNIDNSTFTSGTMTGCVVNGAASVAGATSIVFDGASGATHTLKKYDILLIAGYGQAVVAADVTASSSAGTITLTEPLREDVANDVVITVYDGGGNTRKLEGALLHKKATAFFSVPMAVPPGMEGTTMTDPATGISLRVLMQGAISSKKTTLSMDILFGTKIIDPRLAAQIVANVA